MIKLIFDNLKSVHFSTALLESLDWDEDAANIIIEQLADYFEKNLDKNPALVREELDSLFDKSVCNIIYNYIDYFSKRIQQEKGSIEYEA